VNVTPTLKNLDPPLNKIFGDIPAGSSDLTYASVRDYLRYYPGSAARPADKAPALDVCLPEPFDPVLRRAQDERSRSAQHERLGNPVFSVHTILDRLLSLSLGKRDVNFNMEEAMV
jgi:hypothetical protein